MNVLTIGLDTRPLLHHTKVPCLVIDDGPFIDQLTFPKRRAIHIFDPLKDSFNPLKDMNYRRARDFVDIINAVFPEGENTLTRKNSTYVLLEALLEKPKRLETLIGRSKETEDAWQKIQTLLLSPVLKRVLNNPTNFPFTGTILARLNRAELGDFDCFVLGNFLISQYKGVVVVPDFGFYAIPSHIALIRQNRLMAGIHSFSEITDPTLKTELMLIPEKIASQCLPDDADLLATYAGLIRGTNEYHDFIHRSITVPESG